MLREETETEKKTVHAKHSHRLLVFIPGGSRSQYLFALKLGSRSGLKGTSMSLASINLWLAMGWNVLQVMRILWSQTIIPLLEYCYVVMVSSKVGPKSFNYFWQTMELEKLMEFFTTKLLSCH